MSVIVPLFARFLATRFKDLCVGVVPGAYFTGLEMLFAYFLMEYDSVSDQLRQSTWTLSESHFLSMVSSFPANRFMRRLRSTILNRYKGSFDPKHFIFAVDDTDNPKYANIASVSNFRSSKGKYVGQKVMVLVLVNERENFAVPLSFKFCTPKSDPNHIKGTTLAVTLIQETISFGFPKLTLVADSWFDSVEIAAKLDEIGVPYVWEMKSNRNVKSNPGPKVKWSKLGPLFKGIERTLVTNRLGGTTRKWVAELRILLKNRKRYIKAIAVFNRKNGRDAFAFYGSTDLSMSGARIWRVARSRWAIECLFRDLKQNLNFGRFKSANENAVNLAVVIPLIVITLLRLEPRKFGLREGMTVGAMVAELRKRVLDDSINYILREPNGTKIQQLANRRSQITGKPCTTTCGRYSHR